MAGTKGLVKEEIINTIISMIMQGSLNKGDFLPSIRSMSAHYNTSRGTVLVVYKHLESMGYIQGFERSGYVVAIDRCANALESRLQHKGASSNPYLEGEDLTERQLNKLLQRKPCKLPPHFIKRWASNYDNFSRSLNSMNGGHLQRFLKLSRGITIDERSLLLLSGYREALGLIALFLQQQQKKVLIVEDPCSPEIKELFRLFNFEIISVATDDHGLRVDALPDIHDAALLCMPTLQYPTATRLSDNRKHQLYRWASKHKIIIIEDDSYAMLGFGKSISPPLFLCQNRATIIYLTQLVEMLGCTYNLAIIGLPPLLEEPFKRLNQSLHSHYPPSSFFIVESFLSSTYLMKYLTTLIEERQAKARIAKIICTEQLITQNLNFQEESGFFFFSAKKADIAEELINTVFFPFPLAADEQKDAWHLLFPHTLLTLSELEKLRLQLSTPLSIPHRVSDKTQKKSPHL